MSAESKIVVEKNTDGYVAYLTEINGVIVAEGDTYEDAIANLESAIQFHVDTFGQDSLNRS